MKAFEYASPRSLRQAVELLAERPGRSEVLAGGTDLLALMKDGVRSPDRVVSVRAVPELQGISFEPGEGLRVGGAVTLTDLAAHPDLRRHYPAAAWAAAHAAGPQIRNLGTVGGNLCQRPRCWYYRLGYGLLPRRNGESMIRSGDNRYHAILGNAGDALFVAPSTLAPILIALGGRVALAGPEGEREVALADFYRTPASEDEREHDLAEGEVVTALRLPPPAAGVRTASYEVRPGKSLDWSLATAAVALAMDGERVRQATVVLGQVAPTPWRAEGAEAALAGERVTDEVAARAAEAAVAGAEPLSMNRYKVQLARAAVRRALLRAASGAGGAGREEG
ncbi:MAG TPA: FAD binding domain-containing protein [Thermoanaerobaculia bacterium]|nr:FAD binding domain-containing protein [Thermoanaerobaculia bacterium]